MNSPLIDEISYKAKSIYSANEEIRIGKDRCNRHISELDSWWDSKASKTLSNEYREIHNEIRNLMSKISRLESCTRRLSNNVQRAENEREQQRIMEEQRRLREKNCANAYR